jgi:GcrA cell cycle regulator
MSWTDERVEKLQEMWAEGMSAAQIAKTLGGVTRNAVIGKVHRLGLSNRAAPGKPGGPEDPEALAEVEIEAAPQPSLPTAPEPVVEAAPEPVAPAAPPRPVARDLQRREPAPMSEDRKEALANLAEIEKTARRVSLLDLTERVCKWPIGDPTEPNFHFCGLPAVPGKPYCAAHVTVAFQPMSSRRDRDRQRIRG